MVPIASVVDACDPKVAKVEADSRWQFSCSAFDSRGCDSAAGLSKLVRPNMKLFYNILIMALCVSATGCHKAGVQFTELHTAPIATLTNDLVTVHFQGFYLGGENWAKMTSRMEGSTLCVSGYQTSSEPEMDHDYSVRLPAAVSPQSLNVVWVNPDGSRVPIPFAK
jgi:hypothetical protein